jgi:hypothetical protein
MTDYYLYKLFTLLGLGTLLFSIYLYSINIHFFGTFLFILSVIFCYLEVTYEMHYKNTVRHKKNPHG